MNIETQEHLPTLRNLLAFRIRELGSELHALEQAREAGGLDADDGAVKDRKDEAEAHERSGVEAESERVERDELQRCERALHRLDLGIYGDCVDCSEPITLERLMVQPEAERCAACQAEFEHRHPRPRGRA